MDVYLCSKILKKSKKCVWYVRTWVPSQAPAPPPTLWEYNEGCLKGTVQPWVPGQLLDQGTVKKKTPVFECEPRL